MRIFREPGFGRALIACVASVVLLGSCKPPVGGGSTNPKTRPDRSQAFAEPAAPLTTGPSGAPIVDTSAPPGRRATPSTTAAPVGQAAANSQAGDSDATPETTVQRPFRSVTSAADAGGDAGLEAPGYADLRSLTIETDGTSARVTLDLGGAIPERLAEGEVMGLGVDLFRSSGSESDFQLFAEGTPDGWYAHLQTPDGFVRYSGVFAVGGTKVLFQLPWSMLGGPPPFRVSSFSDWSRKRIAVNASADDALPNQGRLDVAG